MPAQSPVPPSPNAIIQGAAAVTAAGKSAVAAIPGAKELGDLADQARAVRAWISHRHNWTRVAWFASGAVMFTVGAVMVGQRPFTSAAGAVTKPVGAVVKGVTKR